MDIAQTHGWIRAVMAVGGALSIYLGYRLFCDIVYQKPVRRSILFTNMASGALLALFGLGVLIAGARGSSPARSSDPSWQKKSSDPGSFERPKFNSHKLVTDRFV